MAVGDPAVTITINSFERATTKLSHSVTVQGNATEADEPEKIDGYFWTSGSRGRGYNAGAVEVEIYQRCRRLRHGEISHKEVSAGSTDEEITVDFTAVGSMDGGAVRLVIPDDWGDLQDEDATEANYVEVDVVEGRGSAEANVADRAVIANLTGVEKGSVVRFSYGGGTVASRNGAEVEPSIRTVLRIPLHLKLSRMAMVMVSFADVRGMQRTKAVQEGRGNKGSSGKRSLKMGTVYDSFPGMLFVTVTGADDGSGTAEVEIVSTAKGEGEYPDDQDSDGDGNRTEVLDDSDANPCRRYGYLSQVHLHTDPDHPKRSTEIQDPRRME